MTSVIVDSSLAIKWELEEEYSIEARFLYSAWESSSVDLIVPSWFICEIANVLFQRWRRGILEPDRVLIALDAILRETRHIPDEPILGRRAIEIAWETMHLASYDAFYIALAEYLECELWTADERLWRSTHLAYPFVRWLGNVVIVESTS